MTFETGACKTNLVETTSGIPNQPEHDNDKLCKGSRSRRHPGRSLRDRYPELKADQLNNAVREGQAVTTELGANASAITYWVSRSDGWHLVTTVDTVIGKDGNAEKHAVVRFSSVLLPGSPS